MQSWFMPYGPAPSLTVPELLTVLPQAAAPGGDGGGEDPAVWHNTPLNPDAQTHVGSSVAMVWPARLHVPPFMHGSGSQGLAPDDGGAGGGTEKRQQ